jgi:hypothetical protein
MKSACLALCLCISSAAALAQGSSFDMAVQDYRDARWSSAYGRFYELANNGDANAARIALFMVRHGKLLYKSDWDATEDDVELWTRLADTKPRRGDLDRMAVATTTASASSAYWPRLLKSKKQ